MIRDRNISRTLSLMLMLRRHSMLRWARRSPTVRTISTGQSAPGALACCLAVKIVPALFSVPCAAENSCSQWQLVPLLALAVFSWCRQPPFTRSTRRCHRTNDDTIPSTKFASAFASRLAAFHPPNVGVVAPCAAAPLSPPCFIRLSSVVLSSLFSFTLLPPLPPL